MTRVLLESRSGREDDLVTLAAWSEAIAPYIEAARVAWERERGAERECAERERFLDELELEVLVSRLCAEVEDLDSTYVDDLHGLIGRLEAARAEVARGSRMLNKRAAERGEIALSSEVSSRIVKLNVLFESLGNAISRARSHERSPEREFFFLDEGQRQLLRAAEIKTADQLRQVLFERAFSFGTISEDQRIAAFMGLPLCKWSHCHRLTPRKMEWPFSVSTGLCIPEDALDAAVRWNEPAEDFEGLESLPSPRRIRRRRPFAKRQAA